MSVTQNAAIAYVSRVRDLQEIKHKGDQHTVPEWLIITRRQLQKVEDAWYEGRKSEAIHRLAHVAACSIAAIEQNGEAPKPEFEAKFEAGCCPRDGDPCEHAGDGTRCCDRPN